MTLYEILSVAPITLNDEHHIYIHKETKEFYNSVTGALSLFKPKFNEKEILNGLSTQYSNFHIWYFKEKQGRPDLFVESLINWVNYKNYRTPTGIGRYGKQFRRLQEYASVEELNNELEYHKAVYKTDKEKNIYLNESLLPFSKMEMKEMWVYLTDIANHYGNLVHITNERLLLKQQGIVNEGLYKQMLFHYFEMERLLGETKTKFPHSQHSFKQYYIGVSINEFIEFLEQRFMAVKFDSGRCVVPEKMLLHKKLAGMTDLYIDIDDNNFDIGDHKTNKNYTYTSAYGDTLLYPFNNYDNCEHNLYTFQTNIYTNMIEHSTGKKGREMWIIYFDRSKMDYDLKIIERKKEEAEYIIETFHTWQDGLRTKFLSSSLGEMIKQNIPEIWMNHFLKQLYYDIEDKKMRNELDQDKVKWKKTYMKFIEDYVVIHKKVKA